MATIVFASSKGGAGKTTTALTLAFVTSHHGTPTTIIDGDPNRPIAKWAERFPQNVPANLKIVEALGDNVMDAIDDTTTPLTIVDLEGSKNQEVSVGIGRADLVLIPLNGSRLDADEATSVMRVIKRQEAAFRRKIPYRLMMTRTSVVVDRHTQDIIRQFRENNIPMLASSLGERGAYKATFHSGPNLYQLTKAETPKPADAIKNAETLAAEIQEVLKTVLTQARESETVA